MLARGISIPPPDLPYHEIANAAAQFARAGAFWRWQHNGKVNNAIRDGDNTFDAALRVPWQPKLAVAAMFEGFQVPMSALGLFARTTPLSTHGPMCQGSLISFSTIAAHKLAVIGHLRLGAKSLHMPVLSLGREAMIRDRSGDEDHDPCNRFELRDEACPLCGLAPIDTYHLACVCTSPHLMQWRRTVTPYARHLIAQIAEYLRVAHESMGYDISRLCDEVKAEAANLSFDSVPGSFILYRLLICHPWSARMAPADLSYYSVSVCGSLFDLDGVHNSLLRPLANLWGRWCIRWGWRLGNARREAHAALDAVAN